MDNLERLFASRYGRVLRFLVSGGFAAATNLAVFYACLEFLKLWYITSAVVAFVISFTVSFTMQKFWTFQDRAIDVVHHQLAKYLFVSLINLATNTAFLYGFVEYAHLPPLLAQVITMGLIACVSFFVYQRLIFRPDTLRHSARQQSSQ